MRTHLLTASQRDQLERQLRDTSNVGVFRRTLAMLEAGQGRSIAEMARLLRTSRPSVYAGLEAYHAIWDPRSLEDHRGGNRPTRWTPELWALRAASLQSAPDHWGYAAVEWTLPLLQASVLALAPVGVLVAQLWTHATGEALQAAPSQIVSRDTGAARGDAEVPGLRRTAGY
jgi:hypothetical protein